MAFDSLKSDISDYKEKKTDLKRAADELNIEIDKAADLVGNSGGLDENIAGLIRDVRDSFGEEEMELAESGDQLEREKYELKRLITDEQAKLNSVQKKIDGISGKKYSDGLETVERRCGELLEELKRMLAEIESDAGGDSSFGTRDNKGNISVGSDNVDSFCEDEKSRITKEASGKFSGLSMRTFSRISPFRIEVAQKAFSKAPDEILSALEACTDHLRPTADTGYSYNEDGQRVKDGCYYSPADHQVRMDERLGDEEYGEILLHELSHFMDHERGWESRSDVFRSAIQADWASMDTTPEGRMKLAEMLDDAFSTGAAFDRHVSDILSAVFVNKSEIIQRFNAEGVAYYYHNDEYWSEPYNREAEIYADLGAVRCFNERISKNFLERYFPTIYGVYGRFYGLQEEK